MDRETWSSKRRLITDNVERQTPQKKCSKSVPIVTQVSGLPSKPKMGTRLLGMPKVNKPISVKTKASGQKKTAQATKVVVLRGNNNAQVDPSGQPQPETLKAGRAGAAKMATQDLDPQHEEDNLKFAVNASEDEFLDEEGQEGESRSDLSIQESNDEQSDSDR